MFGRKWNVLSYFPSEKKRPMVCTIRKNISKYHWSAFDQSPEYVSEILRLAFRTLFSFVFELQ
jgi:hypothetical protein